jgi:hypothetical protein
MGLYDEVWFDEELPNFPSGCRQFQTKSLDRAFNRYAVSKTGRLCLTGRVLSAGRPEVVREIDTNFHGDIRLISNEGKIEEYVARFRDGALEWIRPLADASRFGEQT